MSKVERVILDWQCDHCFRWSLGNDRGVCPKGWTECYIPYGANDHGYAVNVKIFCSNKKCQEAARNSIGRVEVTLP